MNQTETFDSYLESLNACKEAREWAKGKTWKEVFETCHRGDWLLWLFKRSNPNDLQLLTLAKGHCANTVRHLMKDERSIKAVDAAIAFGEEKISIDELNAAHADADAYAAADAYGAYAAVYATADAEKENQKLTADICRKYLPFEIWNISKSCMEGENVPNWEKDKIFQAHFILGGIIAIFVCQIIVYFYLINSLLNRGSKFLASFKLSFSFDFVSVLILHSIGTYFIVKTIRHLVKYIKENKNDKIMSNL